MADVQVDTMPVRERSAAVVHHITYTRDEGRPTTDPISMFNTYEVDEYIDIGGRLVRAADVPISINVDVHISSAANISVIAQPWQAAAFAFDHKPTARWVSDEMYMEESGGQLVKWHSLDGSELSRPWYKLTGAVTALHSANVQVPQYSYRSGNKWLTCDAVSVGMQSIMRIDLDEVEGGSALMVVGTFDKAGEDGYRLFSLSFGIDELWFGINPDDSCGVHLNDDSLFSIPFPYGPGRLTGVLLVDSPDGATAVVRTSDGVQRSATSRGMTSLEIGPSSASLYGTSNGDSEYVDASLWLGSPDMAKMRQQLTSLMAYYQTRVR